jgi:hypothetical protein
VLRQNVANGFLDAMTVWQMFSSQTPSLSLVDFISAVRTADTLEQERLIVSTEHDHIRALVRDNQIHLPPRTVAKLVFLDLLGEDAAWGQMEAITLMAHDVFSYKRIGYLGSSLLLNENSDLAVLVTQTLLDDVNSADQNVQCLALTFIANVGSTQICRSVAPAVQRLIQCDHARILKGAGMAIVHIVRKVPEIANTFKNLVQPLLNHKDHGVIISGINAVIAMIENDPRFMLWWRHFSHSFTSMLKTVLNLRANPQFSFSKLDNPFLIIRILEALALLGNRSDTLDRILWSIVSSEEPRRNQGLSVLYQAVATIVSVSTAPALRSLAICRVGALLSRRNPNTIHWALSSFARVLNLETSSINHAAVDVMALNGCKSAIVKCTENNDPSIRRRASQVLAALTAAQDIEPVPQTHCDRGISVKEAAVQALRLTGILLTETSSDQTLSRDCVMRATGFRPCWMCRGEKALAEIDRRLLDVVLRFQTHLLDIHAHLSVLPAQDAGVSGLITVIDQIQQRLTAIQFEIVAIQKKHVEERPAGARSPPAADDRTNEIVVSGHQSWLNYQVAYVKAAMQSVIRLYTLVADGQGS